MSDTIDFPGAITVYADQVVAGDKVFDLHGNSYPVVTSATEGKRQIVVREDGWSDHHMLDDMVAIIPGDGDLGRNLDRSSSGSVQGYIDTGRYSSENEEREMNPGSHA